MPTEKLLIIHQGALGDIILTFPAIIRLQDYYDPIDVLFQSKIGKLTKALGLVEKWYPLEAAYVSSLFTDQIHSKIKKILKPYTHIIFVYFIGSPRTDDPSFDLGIPLLYVSQAARKCAVTSYRICDGKSG